MAIRDRAGAYQCRSLEERGKPLTGIIGPLVAELDPAEAPALAEDELHFLVCRMSNVLAKKERALTNMR